MSSLIYQSIHAHLRVLTAPFAASKSHHKNDVVIVNPAISPFPSGSLLCCRA